MRAQEFINEEAHIPEHFRKRLEQQGYKFLGQGSDQAAFTVPGKSDIILKIFGSSSIGDSRDFGHDMFFEWVNFCKKHKNNPFLPKFGDIERVTIDGKRYIMMYQEKLHEDDDISRSVTSLSNYLENIPFSKEMLEREKENATKILSSKGVDVDSLMKTLKQLLKVSQANGYEFDARGNNTLVRSNGQPVIHDPWA